MNLIPKIAELLGVEVGEEFGIQEVEDCDTEMFRFKYRFTQTELQFKSGDYWIPATVPTSLLMGKAEIKKLPFEPKDGEQYWIVVWTNDNIFTTEFAWKEISCICCGHKYCGNVFRSEEEAEKHKFEIYEKLTGKKWENA